MLKKVKHFDSDKIRIPSIQTQVLNYKQNDVDDEDEDERPRIIRPATNVKNVPIIRPRDEEQFDAYEQMGKDGNIE